MTDQRAMSKGEAGKAVIPPRESGMAEFESIYNESLGSVLDLRTWTMGEDLLSAYAQLEREVAEAVQRESDYRRKVREIVFSRLASSPSAPRNAGVYQATPNDLERVHTGLLFNGGVEGCDGTSIVHDTIPLTITQIGVCLVSYSGQQGAWAHRLFRRDLRARVDDPVEEVLSVLERRERRDGRGHDSDDLSELTRHGIMSYAERVILKDRSEARWRMGHGSPAPFEILTGLWSLQLSRIRVSLELIEWYIKYGRFVFVPSAPRRRHLLMIGHALNPLEFAVVHTLEPDIQRMIDQGHYRDENGVRPLMREFAREVASKVVVGLYRVWEGSPPYVFFAQVDHAETAAHIAMADSMLQEHRGFPMLIDLADTVCKTTFGVDAFVGSVQLAYAETGEPLRYLGERETRAW